MTTKHDTQYDDFAADLLTEIAPLLDARRFTPFETPDPQPNELYFYMTPTDENTVVRIRIDVLPA